MSPSAVAERAVQPLTRQVRWPKPDPSHCPEIGGQISAAVIRFTPSVVAAATDLLVDLLGRSNRTALGSHRGRLSFHLSRHVRVTGIVSVHQTGGSNYAAVRTRSPADVTVVDP